MSNNHSKPVLSLKNFTSNIIDYAGLFPPASLELAQAFHNYVFYSQGENRWMLNKFIIPAKKLEELSKLMADMNIKNAVNLSVLGSGGENMAEFHANFENDLANIGKFLNENKNISVDAFETRLPGDLFEKENSDDILNLMISCSDLLEKTTGKNIPLFYEATLNENYESQIIKIAESLASLNKGCGYKLRTGGTEPSAFPAAEVIAFAIMTCCEFNVPMKCTAGLHHPVKHFNNSVNTYMHGFFNIFGAGILAYTSGLDEDELLEIINDEDPYEFIFSENGFEWNEIEVSNAQIKQARENLMISYGSCSFDEPIEDLKMLELL